MPGRKTRVAKVKTETDRERLKKKLKAALATSTSEEVISEGPVYFWRETDSETGYLSQWFACPFRDPQDGTKIYKTAEHYMVGLLMPYSERFGVLNLIRCTIKHSSSEMRT
jgi:hypothetical protein